MASYKEQLSDIAIEKSNELLQRSKSFNLELLLNLRQDDRPFEKDFAGEIVAFSGGLNTRPLRSLLNQRFYNILKIKLCYVKYVATDIRKKM